MHLILLLPRDGSREAAVVEGSRSSVEWSGDDSPSTGPCECLAQSGRFSKHDSVISSDSSPTTNILMHKNRNYHGIQQARDHLGRIKHKMILV